MTSISNVRTNRKAQRAEAMNTVTPSQALIEKAANRVEFSLSNGKRAALMAPGPLAQFRLVRMLGAQAAANTTYVQMLMPLLYVAELDGLPVVMNTEREIEALIVRLGDDGVNEIFHAVMENFGARAEPEQVQADIKN